MAEIQVWVEKAEEDWLSAKWLLQDASPVTTPAAFHLQQAVEKWIKAYLVKNSISFERKHDLHYLAELSHNDLLKHHTDIFDALTPFAVEIRYPGDLPGISKKELRSLLADVERFRVDVLRLLTQES